MPPTFFEARNLSKSFRGTAGQLDILQNIDLSIGKGEIIAIVGPSGAGKTTLLQILGLLDRPSSGGIYYQGNHVSKLGTRKMARLRNQEFAFIFQFYNLLYELNALENVLLPAMIQDSILSWFTTRSAARAKAKKLLEEVGLKDRIYHRSAKLSGGRKATPGHSTGAHKLSLYRLL